MKVMFPSRLFVAAGLLFLSSHLSIAQNEIKLFTPIAVRGSATSTGFGGQNPPYTMGSSTVTLTCSGTPSATLSGTSNGTGNLLVDNNIFVTVMQNNSTITQSTNVCPLIDGQQNPGEGIYTNDCFAGNWRSDAYSTNAGMTSSDTWALTDGVPPIALDSYMSSVVLGQPFTLMISLLDEGGLLASSSIYLTTSCTINGVGAGTIGGNPLNGGQGDSQTFTFNPNTSGLKGIQFGYNITAAFPDPESPPNGNIPNVSDIQIDPTEFQGNYVPKTSFATSNCLVHSGEVLLNANNQIISPCKLYTLKCEDPMSGATAGANCPISKNVNEVFSETFDGPQFNLYDIHNKSGGVIHEGIGFLMASDDWPGTLPNADGNCQFAMDSGPVAPLPCPLNLITSFTGPGGFTPTGIATNPNSEFVVVAGVPLDKTTVTVVGQKNGWVSTSTPTLNFDSQAPNLTPAANGYPYIMVNGVKKVVPGASSYIPQPIASITYGITPIGSVPNPASEPISTDTPISNDVTCMYGTLTKLTQPDFITSSTVAPLADGQYVVHYYAQDCAGTQELFFHQAPGTQIWATDFYTIPLNVDTTKPAVTVTSPNLPTFTKGSAASVSYYCTDANTGSGVVTCGSHAVGATFQTVTLTTPLSTSQIGNNKSYTINAIDGAGNSSSVVYYYNVVAAP